MTVAELAAQLAGMPPAAPVLLAPIGDQIAYDTEDSPPEPIDEVQHAADGRVYLIGGGW